MTLPRFQLRYNRSGLGCLLLLFGAPLLLIVFWLYVPKGWLLRWELELQLRRIARTTIQMSDPSVISVLQEYLQHEDPQIRTTSVFVAGDFFDYHQNESEPLVTTLCQIAQQDQSNSVRADALVTLRKVHFSSPEIDQTILKLLDDPQQTIWPAAEELLLTRITRELETSPELCRARVRLMPYLEDSDPKLSSTKRLKAFLEQCEKIEQK
ncbi:MAG: HEAT repeat domain-containing protein [Planctomycetaceae bacterium]|nr:HEAT repeat domain-containing protein [Planctomycetaceae bacterium]